MEKNEKRQELLTASYGSLVVKLCIPAIIGMVVIALYSFMDSIYAGQMIGEHAMAAIGVSYPLTLINNSIAVLFGMGGASVLSRAIGGKDEYVKNGVLPTVTFLVIVTSLVSTVLGIFGAHGYLRLTGTEGLIFEEAKNYLQIVFIGSIFVNLTQALNMLMRAEGRMIQAMAIMGSGAILNIILDPIFILMFPNIGTRSVAYATLVSQIFQAIITIFYFVRISPHIKWQRPQIYKGLPAAIIPVGISGMMMQFATMIQQTLFYRVAGNYGGESYVIILSAILRIQMFAFIPLWGASQGFQPFVGTNYGAEKYLRLLRGRKTFMLFAFILSLVFFLPMEIVPDRLLSWFIPETQIVAAGIYPARAMFSTFWMYGFMALMGIYFQAIGDAKTAGIVIVGRNLILFVPVVFFLPATFGAAAIWWIFAVCDVVAVGYGMMMYMKHGRLLHAWGTGTATPPARKLSGVKS
ncbi:MAG: MATE family efflux transporter [Eubacteriales bacterium]|nr:MATE family efflux transporter [Eubacteriales bacterium]